MDKDGLGVVQSVTVSTALHRALCESAALNGRSIGQELEARLIRTFSRGRPGDDIQALLDSFVTPPAEAARGRD